VPEVNDENDAVLTGVIPGLVFEVVIEHQAPSHLPLSGLLPDAQRTIAFGHDHPEMAP
jgi:hypothetical protein